MKDLIFESWHQWKVCFLSGAKNFLWGLWRILTCIFFGILSVIVWLWKRACSWVGKYPNVALGGFICVVVIMFVLMFANNRAKVMGLEAQRDSISYQYQEFKESHGYE